MVPKVFEPFKLLCIWFFVPNKFYVLGQIGTDQDQTASEEAVKKQSDQGLRCLPFYQHLLDAFMQCDIKLFYL